MAYEAADLGDQYRADIRAIATQQRILIYCILAQLLSYGAIIALSAAGVTDPIAGFVVLGLLLVLLAAGVTGIVFLPRCSHTASGAWH